MNTETATFGAGCFWGAEAFFRAMDGVVETKVGYATGTDGSTPPARIEVVQISFDPQVLNYPSLIELFWKSHNPTSFDRQGGEVGEGVRSAIFYHSESQRKDAIQIRDDFNARSALPATTQIIPYGLFELADERHQRYLEKNGSHACAVPASA